MHTLALQINWSHALQVFKGDNQHFELIQMAHPRNLLDPVGFQEALGDVHSDLVSSDCFEATSFFSCWFKSASCFMKKLKEIKKKVQEKQALECQWRKLDFCYLCSRLLPFLVPLRISQRHSRLDKGDHQHLSVREGNKAFHWFTYYIWQVLSSPKTSLGAGMGKVVETMIGIWLQSSLKETGYLYSFHSGFRPGQEIAPRIVFVVN